MRRTIIKSCFVFCMMLIALFTLASPTFAASRTAALPLSTNHINAHATPDNSGGGCGDSVYWYYELQPCVGQGGFLCFCVNDYGYISFDTQGLGVSSCVVKFYVDGTLTGGENCTSDAQNGRSHVRYGGYSVLDDGGSFVTTMVMDIQFNGTSAHITAYSPTLHTCGWPFSC